MAIMKKILDSKITIVLALLLLTVVASVPAFRSAVYEGDDLRFHMGRIQAIAEALSGGQIPVRYEANAWYGHGYISSLFYGNIFLYIPALLFLAGMPIYRTINVYILIINLVTVLIGYYSFKGLFKDRYWAVFATACYTLAGYRLTNIYVRSAVGEFTAITFLPLCIYGIYRIYRIYRIYGPASINNTDGISFGSDGIKRNLCIILPFIIGVTGLIQSHVLTSEMMALYIIVFVILNIKDLKRVFYYLILSLVIIVLLNAFFIIPFIDSYTSMDLSIKANTVYKDIQENGLTINHLFGIITNGGRDVYFWPMEKDGCLNTGIVILICELLTFIYAALTLFKHRKGVFKQDINKKWFFQLILLGVLSMWMSTKYFPWKVVSSLGFLGKIIGAVQYPWRYILIQNIIFVLTGTYAAKNIVKIDWLKYTVTIVICMLAVLMTGIFYYQLSFGRCVTSEQAADNWADKLYLPVGTDAEALENRDVLFTDTKAILPIIAYDNIHVFDSNNNEIVSERWDGNLIAIDKSSYNDDIQVKYVEPWYWRISEIVSAVCLVALVVNWILQRRNIY